MRYLTSGESHGPQLTAIIDGIPAGMELTTEMINEQLAERQKGYGRGGRMKIEKDRVKIVSGVRHGKTLGSPITLIIENIDFENWQSTMAVEAITHHDYEVKTVPRPGHADLVGAVKYNHRDLRNVLERSSARETAIRVAVGAIAKQLLNHLGIEIFAHVLQIGSVCATKETQASFLQIKEQSLHSAVRCADEIASKKMCECIDEAKRKGDSLGGIAEVVATNVPQGLGSYVSYLDKLDAKIAAAMMSVQSVKGVHFGDALFAATHVGSLVHDQIKYVNGYVRSSNTYGGFEGGMTNGMPLLMTALIKPIPTLYKPLDSVDINTKEVKPSMIERSDTCVVPAACVVLESVVAIELAKTILEEFQSNHLDQLVSQVESYRIQVREF